MSLSFARILFGSTVIDLRSAMAGYTGREGYLITNPDELVNPGARTHRRYTVQSPFINGETIVHSVLAATQLQCAVLVLSATPSVLQQRLADLVGVLDQDSFTFAITQPGGVEYRWRCYEADYATVLNRRMLYAGAAEVRVSAPRDPLPLMGPI